MNTTILYSSKLSDNAKLFKVIVNVYLSWFFFIFGMIGNSLCLYVFSYFRDKNAKSSATFLLQALAVSDFGILIFHLISENVKNGYDTGFYPAPEWSDMHRVVMHYLFSGTQCWQFIGTWMIAAISVDR